MKYLILLLPLLLVGCVTPSESVTVTETFFGKDTGKVEKVIVTETVKYENSVFTSYKVLGFEVKPYDPVTKTFSFKALYGHMESARVAKGQTYHSDFGFKDISLLTASGSAYHSFYVGPEKVDNEYFDYMKTQVSNKKNILTPKIE